MTPQELQSCLPALRQRLLRRARRRLADAARAEDAVQEALLQLWQAAERVAGDPVPLAYVILRRVLIRDWRDRGRKEAGDRPLVDARTGEAIEVPVAPAQETTIRAREAAAAIAALPADQRRAFVAVTVMGEALAAVAAREGVPEGTIKSRAHRGQMAVRAALTRRPRVVRLAPSHVTPGDPPAPGLLRTGRTRPRRAA